MFLKSLLKNRIEISAAIPEQTAGEDELLADSPTPPEIPDEPVIPFENYAPVVFTQDRLIHVHMRSVGREQIPVQWAQNGEYVWINRTSSGVVFPQGGGPIFVVSSIWFLHDTPDLVFHNGITWNSPALAAMVTVEGRSGVNILMPPLGIGEAQREEHVDCAHSKPKKDRVYRFEIEVERQVDGSTIIVREPFEWRKGTGFYRDELGKAKGWELVRMSERKGDGRLTPDGKEIVGGCSKGFHFMRTGSGKTELGSRWALMAFMSSLCIMQHRYA